MALATLSIDLVAKLANLEAGFTKAQHLAEQSASKIDGAFSKVRALASGIGAGLIAGLASFSFVSFIKDTNEGVAALVDLKNATGASIENLSALEDVARRSGASFDAVESVLTKFNKALHTTAGAEFSEVREILKGIGLDAEELKRIDPAEALRRVAVAFAQYADDGNKARQFQVLFGKGLKDMAQFFDDLSKQTRLNATVTTQAAEEAKRFSDELASLAKNSVDSARAIVGPLVSGLNDLIKKLRESAAESRAFWTTLREQDATNDRTKSDKARADGIAAITKVLNEGNLSLERRLRLENQLRQLEAGERTQAPKVAPKGGDRIVDSRPSVGPEPTAPVKATKEKISAIDRYIEKLTEQTIAEITAGDATQELARAQLALANDKNFANATDAQRQALLALADGLDKLRNKFDQTVQDAVDHDKQLGDALAELQKQSDKQAEAFRTLLASTPTEQLKELNAEIARLQALFDAGSISAEQFAEVLNIKLGLASIKFVDEWKVALAEVQSRFQDQFADSLVKIFQGNTRSILADWASLLQQMVAKALAAKLGEALFGSTGGDGGWLGSFIKLFSNSGSAGASSGGIPGSAGGGMAAPWSISAVNERGIEAVRRGGQDVLLTGSRGGRVIPNNMLGATPTNVTFNIASGVSRNELASMIPALTEHIKASVAMTMRRPGFRGA